MKKSAIILLHAGYWFCYLLLLLVLMLFMQGHFIFRDKSLFIFFAAFAFIPAVLGFYLFYGFLFVKFLRKKRIMGLILAGILIAFICGCVGWLLLDLVWVHIGRRNKTSLYHDGYTQVTAMMVVMTINALLNGIIGLVMRGFINWYADIKLKEALNKKNYEMELALIKSQISPHFLFNTINNIDVLIEKDNIQASAYLNKLSDILRFMLYETKTEKVLLAKELSYIGKYIDLQKIRSANADYIHYSVEGNAGDQLIAPMLFIPFIENAFKHAENKKAANTIDIRIFIEKNSIRFNCRNKYNKAPALQPGYNGLGNELIHKRLGLLYPGRHELAITDENNVYCVTLILKGNEN